MTKYKWGLPVLSALLLILSIPPFSIGSLAIFGLIPIFVFTRLVSSTTEMVLGWSLFGLLYASFVTVSTFGGFYWIEEAVLFTFFVKSAATAAVVLTVLIYSLYILLIAKFIRNFPEKFTVPLLAIGFLGLVLVEQFFFWIYSGFHYGALFFAVGDISIFRNFILLGSPLLISLVVLLTNILLWLMFDMFLIKEYRKILVRTIAVLVAAFLVLLFAQYLAINKDIPRQMTSLRVAIIQDQQREELAFGTIDKGNFSFPVLEEYIEEAALSKPDFIIYPFTPWSGVISNEVDNSRFDREVITISYDIFSDWLKAQVPPETIFVTWYTSYESGNYYNRIGYWQNGELVNTYTKEKLFPFFDYVPSWALKLGIVSLPFDGTAGTDNQSFVYEDAQVGGLVCSEVGNDVATVNSATGSNIIFSLGSEIMFDNAIPGEYNALRARLSATKYNLPFVRANRYGPSVVFDRRGELLGRMNFGENGVLLVDIPIATK